MSPDSLRPRPSPRRLALVPLALAVLGIRAAAAQDTDFDVRTDLRVGHWIEVRGGFEADGVFHVEKLEVLQPQEENVLIGTVEEGDLNDEGFVMFGQQVDVDDDTSFRNVEYEALGGARIKLEGYWRGPRKFSSRTVSQRGEGRDRLAGRVDDLQPVDGGVELRVMRFDVFVPTVAEVELADDVEEFALAPEIERQESVSVTDRRDEDDLFGRGIELAEGLVLRGQIELQASNEDEFDLNRSDDEDRADLDGSTRLRFVYARPDLPWYAVAEARYSRLWRYDGEDGHVEDDSLRLGEAFVYWRNLLGDGWDVQVGRQDFDDPREWLYDQNLDAVRVIGYLGGSLLEVSASTVLAGGGDVDEAATNLLAYYSHEMDDGDIHLAAWSMLRDFEFDDESRVDEERWHFGARALGEFVDDHESWLDLSLMRGDREGQELSGWAYDVGTIWQPAPIEPLYLTFGYALGSGGRVDADEDARHRQTGLQDNNGKFGGVTSFRYYGELVDPELSNLGVATLGVGSRLSKKTSLDLVWHHYRQDQLLDQRLVDSDLDGRPSGLDADLGWELDLVLGSRRWDDFDLEVVGGWFHPGNAFPDGDDAYLAKIQLRYRF